MESHEYRRDVFSAHAESLSKLAARITHGGEVLELGPASGYFTRILRDQLQCQVDAIEIDDAMAEQARPYCRDLLVGDLDVLVWDDLFPERRYDWIIAADVLEHLCTPERALRALRERLKPSGKLLISLPNIAYAGMIFGLLEDDFRYRAEGLLDRTHLKFFTRTTLEEMLTAQGWRVTWRGEVQKDLYEAEFHTRLEQWPPTLREFVVEHPARAAYQLLCECESDAVVPAAQIETISSEKISKPQFAMRLMWATAGATFDFTRGASAFASIGERKQSLRWRLPENADVIRIRLSDRSGYLHVHGIRIVTGGGASRAISLDDCTFSDDIVRAGALLTLASNEGWLQLPAQRFAVGDTIEIDCDWPMSSDFLSATEAVRAQADQHAKALMALEQSLHASHERARAFETRMLAHEALISERDALLEARNAHVAHLEALVAERERIIVERDAQLQARDVVIAQLDAMTRQHTAQIESLRTARGWLRDYRARRKGA